MKKISYIAWTATALSSVAVIVYVIADSKRYEKVGQKDEELAKNIPVLNGDWKEYLGIKPEK